MSLPQLDGAEKCEISSTKGGEQAQAIIDLHRSVQTRGCAARSSLDSIGPIENRLLQEDTMKLKSATQRQFWIWLIIFLAYLVVESVGFYLIPQWMGYKGKLPIFALNNPPPYSAAQALAFVNEYGSSGRAAYTIALAFDVLFPFLYAMVLSVGLRLIVGSMNLPARVQWMIGKFPFLAALANWIADIFILFLLNSLSRSVNIATVASVLTSIKFVVLGICIVGLLMGAMYLLGRKAIRMMKRAA